VPFVGAGFSVSAGIPIIWQFHNYLQRCICVALGAERVPVAKELWNPRTDAWPPFIDLKRPQTSDKGQWRKQVYYGWRRQRKLKSRTEQVFQEAIGAMAEWRSALYFLSRLDVDYSTGDPYPVLGVPNQDVLDACLRKVLRANAPSLNHVMLATLSQVLRIDTILTTNFDDLIERAFEASRNRLEVFDVHLGDKLPDFNAVSRVRSIVKIHGSQNSLRADYSLDGPPAYEDRQTFASYLSGTNISGKDGGQTTRNHLLVFGVGVRERRTRGFLLYALHNLTNLKLFFVCFQPSDMDQVEELMRDHYNKHPTEKAERCFVVRHTESGLLLLHLYQWFRKALPHSNAVFPSTTRLSLPPLPEAPFSAEENDSAYRKFVHDLDKKLKHLLKQNGGLMIASSARPACGVTSAGAELFRANEVDNLCLWIEMHDIHNADDLFEAFQEAVHRKLGEADWTPLYSVGAEKSVTWLER
jgi:hypothetical protein